jgi:hypothetical protein
MTEISDIRTTLERVVTLLASIDYKLELLAKFFDGVIKHGEAAPFVEWAEPPNQSRKDRV